MAQSFSHFSHFASSTHRMACQSVVRLSDAGAVEKLWICNNEPRRPVDPPRDFSIPARLKQLIPAGGGVGPRKKNAKVKDTRKSEIYRFGKRDASRRC